MVIPGRPTISHHKIVLHEDRRIKLKAMIAVIPAKISLITDAGSSRVFKGYVSVTAHRTGEIGSCTQLYWNL